MVNLTRAVVISALVPLCVHTSITRAAAPRVLLDECWETTFLEPFDELNLANESNPAGWTTQYIWDRNTIINQELQYYIDPRLHEVNPFVVEQGILSITAMKTPAALSNRVAEQAYVSGVLTSRNWFEQQHGRFEVKAKVPKGQGLWSAFWLLPTHQQWPKGVAILPELDVMEHLGHQPNTFHTTLHTNQTGKLTSHPYDHNNLPDLSAAFHLYSAVWTETEVSWYLDEQFLVSHPSPKDFNTPVHFLLNLAVGGSWPGSPNAQTQFPAKFEIDFVRAMESNGQCD